jgi:hypothetical protein
MKEADFLIASTTTLKFIDENKLHPFLKKSSTVFQLKLDRNRKDDDLSYLFYLPFTVEQEEAMIYAAIYDYSGQAGLGINILWDNEEANEDEMEIVSIPSKYFNYIPSVTLTKGKYYLGIVP